MFSIHVSMSANQKKFTLDKQNSLVCDMSALSREEREEHTRNAEKILRFVEKIRDVTDGYMLHLPIKTEFISQTGAFIAYERLCCPFLHFSLDVESDQGSVWLTVRGNKQVKEYLKTKLVDKLPVKPTDAR